MKILKNENGFLNKKRIKRAHLIETITEFLILFLQKNQAL
ncbi:hypothetical protein LEP1GSC107_3470 [Leptospira interrogans serovar Grippotyphosa str. UI 12769]|uniref:Uncharacterized protein n=2 Tax=Leptospira interrogans TaxID=173 RepID=A0A0F6HF09_LEPIR|nr:hypothetical protein LEP1GSC027_0097 [Leptospira interrogans str. 2002000624]EKO26948.1 hypothetical protein LEP1GSC104_1044 [Leptospira interrogans str. UI 12621]EKQ37224.1 hypothetical protein LEP1GSC025_0088 [Leptospira interrogans str. 2002000621]EKQ48659.1 hypothetical protein LEP1GSC026_2645 [Leptospira interrogans str. 2002000623]EMJ72257.1 hypothetical protein LEP1GSC033_4193 [Leptospira interrogans str. 2002000632]EMJ82632.1 hypothetical protein LEP1GSC032_4661 [Leptospira interrog